MKTINSPVRNVPYDDALRLNGSSKQKTIATAKQIARKLDRARLNAWFTKKVTQYHLDIHAERLEQARIERETAYKNLMWRVKRSSLKHVERKRVKELERQELLSQKSSDADEVAAFARLQVCIHRYDQLGHREIAVLASCG